MRRHPMHRMATARHAAAVLLSGTLAFGACSDGNDDAAPPDDVAVGAASEFSTLDASGDSYLDVDEVAEWVDDEGIFTAWDEDVDSELDRDDIAFNAFDLWDADKNGKVDAEEWKKGTDLWYPENATLAVFGDWDGDGDSELDRDEFTESFDLSPLGEGWQVETFDETTFKTAYFQLYDSDGDGKVSEAEWTAGSAAFGIA